MTKHEQLKEICDKIGYNNPEFVFNNLFYRKYNTEIWSEDLSLYNNILNVREIIFTKEFMDKWIDYRLKDNLHEDVRDELVILLNNLDNTVEYLYNLIK
jgi:hypothetical protein